MHARMARASIDSLAGKPPNLRGRQSNVPFEMPIPGHTRCATGPACDLPGMITSIQNACVFLAAAKGLTLATLVLGEFRLLRIAWN